MLCSPVEPDAVARALASVGVPCSDDADLASVQHFGLAEQRAIPEPAVIPRRRRVLIGASLTIGVLAAASLLPAFAWFRPYVGGAALINSLAVLARQRR